MREDIAGPRGASSRPMWETLEGMVREKAQEFIQQIMEEEVTELLGREKSERRSTVDSAEGYRNGYGKPRRLIGAPTCSTDDVDLWTTGQRIWRASAENPRPLLQAALREQLRGRPLARLGAPFVVRASLPFGATLRGSPAGAGGGLCPL